jgi:hypothetical protein
MTIRYGPSFSPSGFPSRKKASKVCLSVNAGSNSGNCNDSSIAISRFHEQTVREPLAPHRFAKGDISSIRLISAGESECPQDGQTVFTAARTFSGSILFLCIGALQTFRLLVVY